MLIGLMDDALLLCASEDEAHGEVQTSTVCDFQRRLQHHIMHHFHLCGEPGMT